MGKTEKRSDSKWIGATLVAAFLASLCCITPVLAIMAGIGGAASAFSWMEPFRPYLIAASVLVLAFAWYQKIKPMKKDLECACDDEENGKSFMQSKSFLAIVTVLAALLLSFPYYSKSLFPESNNEEALPQGNLLEAQLIIEGMTCAGCEQTVTYSLLKEEGVIGASADYEKGTANVKFNPDLITVEKIEKTIESEVGYSVTKSEILDR